MFHSLSNAIQPKKAKPSATLGKPDDTTEQQKDVKHDIANFNLQPVDNFETLGDKILQELLTEFTPDNNENSNPNIPTPNNTVSTVPLTTNNATGLQPKIVNTQVNTINNPVPNMLATPQMPPMYFSHSNGAINYNFGK